MTVSAIVEKTGAKVLCGEEHLDKIDVKSACGADMMSDVLAYVKDQGMLLTGLVNPQVVRTAEMMDMKCILFVRGKIPDEMTINLARERGIIILTTEKTLFHACGVLYCAGIVAGEKC